MACLGEMRTVLDAVEWATDRRLVGGNNEGSKAKHEYLDSI